MKHADIERFCLSLTGATKSVQWGADRVFKVGGRMFAVMGPPDEKPQRLSFKACEDSFHILTQSDGIVPAPYLARAYWVMLEHARALRDKELKAYLTNAHRLVAAGLPKKTQKSLGLG